MLQQHMHAVVIIDDVVSFMFVELSILVFVELKTIYETLKMIQQINKPQANLRAALFASMVIKSCISYVIFLVYRTVYSVSNMLAKCCLKNSIEKYAQHTWDSFVVYKFESLGWSCLHWRIAHSILGVYLSVFIYRYRCVQI